MWLSIKTIRSRVHVPCSDSTIRRYADLKLIRSKRANNKSKRYYHLNDIQETFQAQVTPDVPENNPRAIVAYCRVSSRKQNSDLVRQVNHIVDIRIVGLNLPIVVVPVIRSNMV